MRVGSPVSGLTAALLLSPGLCCASHAATTERVSVSTARGQGSNPIGCGVASSDGRPVDWRLSGGDRP
jgi:hypothetical protein